MNEIGYLYVIRPAENYAKGEDVFKVGMTIQEAGNSIRRLKGYPKGSEIVTVHQFSADITRALEKKLIAKMAAKYPRCDHGIEYFRVSKIDVIGVFNEIVQEHYKLEASESSSESEPDESDESELDNNSDNVDTPDNIADVPDDVKNRVVENIQQQIIGNNNVVNIIHQANDNVSVEDKTCHDCGKKFGSVRDLQRHKDKKTPCIIRNATAEHMKNPNRCIYCNKIFANMSNKNKHIKLCKNKNGGINVLDEKVDIGTQLIRLRIQNGALIEMREKDKKEVNMLKEKQKQEHEQLEREMEVLKKLVIAQMHMD